MQDRITYMMRFVILAIYCTYAVSPIYLAAMSGKNEHIVDCASPAQKVTVGIVWVKVLFSSFCGGEQETAAASLREVKATDQDSDFILIRKKRAVLPESLRIKPDLEQLAAIATTFPAPVLGSSSHEVPCRKCFRQENMSIFTHAGLSPPLRIS